MRWVRYRQGHGTHYGRLDGETVVEVQGSPIENPTPAETGRRFQLGDVKLLPPVIPPTFYAAGLNYMTHVRKHPDRPAPSKPDIGYRANNALTGQDDPIVMPHDCSGKLQYEGEVVVIIGKQVKNLTPENAMSCIFGYTIGNDVSERVWQKGDRTLWRGKNSDTFKPMGPWIETDFDVDKARVKVRLNGKEVTNFPANDMIFDIPTYLVAMTRYLTLYPGDMVWMGTDEPTLDMVVGDVCEVEIDGLGVLRNPVVAEKR